VYNLNGKRPGQTQSCFALFFPSKTFDVRTFGSLLDFALCTLPIPSHPTTYNTAVSKQHRDSKPTLVLEAFFDSSKATSQIVPPATKPRRAPRLLAIFAIALLGHLPSSVLRSYRYDRHFACARRTCAYKNHLPTYTPLRADNFLQ
jgi:hypothetical protein